MLIQINTDNHISNSAEFTEEIKQIVTSACSKHEQRLTRIEVYLHDENSHKGGVDDKKCSMEARIEGMKPIGVSHHSSTLREAATKASHKLDKLIQSTLGKTGWS